MQMSKFSLSSHPCGMQDESCPNGAHSCYFGGLCRCVPGHPGTTHSHGYFFPGSLCTDGEKWDSTFGRVGSWLPKPPPFTGDLGMLEGGPWAAEAVAGIKLVVGKLGKTGGCS